MAPGPQLNGPASAGRPSARGPGAMPGQRVATHSGGRPTDLATPSLMEPQPAVEPHPLALQLSHVVTPPLSYESPRTGSPLPAAMRARMESAFSADFSAVRVHDDSAAQARATELGTDAFTEGPDVYLGAGTSVADQRLLAHELAHVYQGAGNSAPATGRRCGSNSAVEREAAGAAARVVAGGSAGSLRPSHAAVMRDEPAGGPPRCTSGQSIQVPGRSGPDAVFPGCTVRSRGSSHPAARRFGGTPPGAPGDGLEVPPSRPPSNWRSGQTGARCAHDPATRGPGHLGASASTVRDPNG